MGTFLVDLDKVFGSSLSVDSLPVEVECKVLIHNSSKENEWIDGIITGYRAGFANEDYLRIDVETEYGIYQGCHPDCVKVV